MLSMQRSHKSQLILYDWEYRYFSCFFKHRFVVNKMSSSNIFTEEMAKGVRKQKKLINSFLLLNVS